MSTGTALLIFANTDRDPHHPKVTPALLTALLAESGLAVRVASTAAEVTAAALAACDLAVLWELLGEGNDGAYKILRESVFHGKPLLAFHTAVWSTTDASVPADFLGGTFAGHPPFQTFTVHIASAPHPITAGLADFAIRDEAYQIESCGAVDILAYYDGQEMADPGQQAEWLRAHRRAPLLYTKPYGEGRMVNLALGHDDVAIGHPAYRRLTAQAVRWLLGA